MENPIQMENLIANGNLIQMETSYEWKPHTDENPLQMENPIQIKKFNNFMNRISKFESTTTPLCFDRAVNRAFFNFITRNFEDDARDEEEWMQCLCTTILMTTYSRRAIVLLKPY